MLCLSVNTEERLADFEIWVCGSFDPTDKENFQPRAPNCARCGAVESHLDLGEVREIVCEQPVTGRYPVIWKAEGILTICEFQVYGECKNFQFGTL